MPLKRWLLRTSDRRLQVSKGGKWFILFTIVLGAAAVNSGNNVIYLLESLLLSSLIFSGVLSEYTVSRLGLARITHQAIAGTRSEDIWVIFNKGSFPLYCVEIGEWVDDEFLPCNFVLHIPAKGEVRIRSSQRFERRGKHSWAGFAVATSFPFGFAKKIRLLGAGGERIIWPDAVAVDAAAEGSKTGDWEPAEGELEEVQRWEDISRVHWPSSNRGERLFGRKRRRVSAKDVVVLDLSENPAVRETRIKEASYLLQKHGRVLNIIEGERSIRIDGAWPAMNALALLPEGK